MASDIITELHNTVRKINISSPADFLTYKNRNGLQFSRVVYLESERERKNINKNSRKSHFWNFCFYWKKKKKKKKKWIFHPLPISNDSGPTNWLYDQEAYKKLSLVEGYPKFPFSIAITPFPGLLHFTLDLYLILLIVKQGGIKYHFLSLWYDST